MNENIHKYISTYCFPPQVQQNPQQQQPTQDQQSINYNYTDEVLTLESENEILKLLFLNPFLQKPKLLYFPYIQYHLCSHNFKIQNAFIYLYCTILIQIFL